jgi:ABC-type uncharacterized transport system permease subunit
MFFRRQLVREFTVLCSSLPKILELVSPLSCACVDEHIAEYAGLLTIASEVPLLTAASVGSASIMLMCFF